MPRCSPTPYGGGDDSHPYPTMNGYIAHSSATFKLCYTTYEQLSASIFTVSHVRDDTMPLRR